MIVQFWFSLWYLVSGRHAHSVCILQRGMRDGYDGWRGARTNESRRGEGVRRKIDALVRETKERVGGCK